MDVAEVLRRVGEIANYVGDDERAHSMEDELHQDVLTAIAEDRCDYPSGCARAALMTLELDFARWCA